MDFPSLRKNLFNNEKSILILLVIAITCFSLVIYSVNLSTSSLIKTDENIYLQACLEMYNHGNYLVPTFEGKPRFQKPILFYWLVLSAYKILGISLFSARLVSVIAATITIITVFMFTRKIFSFQIALPTCIILSGSYFFYQYGRAAQTDTVLTLFSTLSLTSFGKGYFLKKNQSRNLFLTLVFTGLAFSIKGGVAILLSIYPIIIFCFFNRTPVFLKKLFKPMNVLVFMILALWHYIYMYIRFKDEFLHHLLSREISERIGWTLHHFLNHLGGYGGELLVASLPFSLFPLIYYVISIRKQATYPVDRFNEKMNFILSIILGVTGFFLVFVSKTAERYILPVYPFYSILVSVSYYRLINLPREFDMVQALSSIIILLIIAMWLGSSILLYALSFIMVKMLIAMLIISVIVVTVLYFWIKNYQLFPIVVLSTVLMVVFAEGVVRPCLQEERELDLVKGFTFNDKTVNYVDLFKTGRVIINLRAKKTLSQIKPNELVTYLGAHANEDQWIILPKKTFDQLPMNLQDGLKIEKKTFRYNFKNVHFSLKKLLDHKQLDKFLNENKEWIYLAHVLLPEKRISHSGR